MDIAMQDTTEMTTTTRIDDQQTDTHTPLRQSVARTLQNYFAQLGDTVPSNVYELVLAEIEVPLLEAVMQKTHGNQTQAAIMLGLSRGTLRKKLKQYSLD